MLACALVALVALTACGETSQQLDPARKAGDMSWKGTGGSYATPGWTAGDQKSWETQLRNRTQRGQDEYPRTGSSS
jgi:hypothetical protein